MFNESQRHRLRRALAHWDLKFLGAGAMLAAGIVLVILYGR
jgi:hypothetical protein